MNQFGISKGDVKLKTKILFIENIFNGLDNVYPVVDCEIIYVSSNFRSVNFERDS